MGFKGRYRKNKFEPNHIDALLFLDNDSLVGNCPSSIVSAWQLKKGRMSSNSTSLNDTTTHWSQAKDRAIQTN